MNELAQLRRDLSGISPKVSTYHRIKARIEELARELEAKGEGVKI